MEWMVSAVHLELVLGKQGEERVRGMMKGWGNFGILFDGLMIWF